MWPCGIEIIDPLGNGAAGMGEAENGGAKLVHGSGWIVLLRAA